MEYLFGAILGLVWGAGAATLGAAMVRHFLKKQNAAMILAGNILRFFMDAVALGACLLLRNSESISFYTAIVGTAASLSILTIVFAYRMARTEKGSCTQTDIRTETNICTDTSTRTDTDPGTDTDD